MVAGRVEVGPMGLGSRLVTAFEGQYRREHDEHGDHQGTDADGEELSHAGHALVG